MSDKVDAANVPPEHVTDALLQSVPMRKFQSESFEDFDLDWKSHPTIDIDKYAAQIKGKDVLGWGRQMSEYLGGVHQGSCIGISANGAGMGKTSYLQQLLDAIALRNDWVIKNELYDEPIMPILMVSELDKYELKLRTLGRYMGVPYSALRSKRRAIRLLKLSEKEADAFKEQAEEFAKGEGLGSRFKPWVHILDPKDRAEFRTTLESDLYILKSETEVSYPLWKGKVWPVVALDPLQRWVASEGDTILGAGSLAIWFRGMCRKNGYIGFFTSDTNKASAAANKEGLSMEQAQSMTGVEAFRGSQEIMHAATAAIVLYRIKDDDSNPHDATRTMYASVVKNRDGLDRVGVSYEWHRPTGLFSEITVENLLDWKEQQKKKPVDAMQTLRNMVRKESEHEVVSLDAILATVNPEQLKEIETRRKLQEAQRLLLEDTEPKG
jgi:hypothetical protein